MTRLEDLQPTAATVRGILPEQAVAVVSVQWFGSEALELTYKGPSGRVANELLYRHDEPRLEVVAGAIDLLVAPGFLSRSDPTSSCVRTNCPNPHLVCWKGLQQRLQVAVLSLAQPLSVVFRKDRVRLVV